MRKPLLGFTLMLALAACGTQTPVQQATGEEIRQEALSPTALGARYTDSTGTVTGTTHVTFRVYSSKATRIEVYLYAQAAGAAEKLKYTLTKDAATSIWKVTVPVSTLTGAGISTVYYGYRAWGPNWTYNSSWTKGSSLGFVSDVDSAGNRFNPNKLLLDPYALEVSHDPNSPTSGNYTGFVYASGPTHRTKDSGNVAPKGIVLKTDTTSYGTKPTRALKDDVVYEVHLRGLTKGDSSITSCAGTYAGAAQKAAYLQSLGITAVEFLPVQETDNDSNDVTDAASGKSATSTNGDNYWGYMTVNYFAPDRRYSCDKSAGGPTKEFKAMVKAFHDRGIKVFIDVVYNHTAEGGTWGTPDTSTIYSFRGLDNSTYYSLTADRQNFWDNTGIGHNYNTRNATAQKLIIDSLKHWRDELGIDGFRFDLASVLGNTCEHGCFNYDKMDSNTALNKIVANVPPRPAAGGSGVDLIAEPWAIGGNSYQVGNFPSGWSEWNGQFRDTLRKDQNQMGIEAITPGQLASKFAGSSDLYEDDGRKPWNSINFMVAHDGFTLKDLYSCNGKNNTQPWPYGVSDGGEDNNHSWDQGNIATDQRKAARNGMAFMLLSAGVPMFNGGDEFLRSQKCNNNAYNLDSSGNWLNYTLSVDQSNFKTFTQNMIAFRKAHPALRPANFYSSVDNNGNVMEQLRWFKPDGNVADAIYFNNASNHALAYRIDATEFGETTQAIYVAYNGWSGAVNFVLPWPGTGKNWYRVTDTCTWAEGAGQVDLNATTNLGGEWTNYSVCGRGVLVLVAK
ncbi:isoamylase [Deinococcus cellulosilyticus]|uniref:Glycogen operon protein GlgX homolog n=1 Tax=Deinococcus cellulosilyticus (strain DSM 18568 / NBRC 106333 / KACC 11606 / 5516J-15) TaxID=1223518 RepID=A0A511N9B5_DEIC1|nr:isoamylase [Deinococcus cellulosilyticus]GEM49432.1 glycogen operon protein GlgX homolog [Deinococcus cellulosilyticus NBRC 106333 = KACC 11606]